MAKRQSDENLPLHIGADDSTDNVTDSSVYNHVDCVKSGNNNIKPRKKIKYLRKSDSISSMDSRLSRKSTTEEDISVNQDSVNNADNLKHESLLSSGDLKLNRQLIFTILGKLASGDGNKESSKVVESTENPENIEKQIEKESNNMSKENNHILENTDDQTSEKLTPSRKADYVHTLLSGRSSMDNSINILNRMTMKTEDNTVDSVKELEREEIAETSVSDNEERNEDILKNLESEDYENENEEERLNTVGSREEVRSINLEHEGSEFAYPNELDTNNFEDTEDEYYDNEENDEEDDNTELMDHDFAEFKEKTGLDKLLEMYRRLYNIYENRIVNGNEKLRVVVRCIPTARENRVIECEKSCIKLLKPGNKDSVFKSQRPGVYEFNFDYIVPEDETTEQLYNESCGDLVEKILSGKNVTVFAYGSTGSGKTHTISGDERSKGLVYLMISDLFEYRGSESEDFYFSYFEVYNENVYDLLVESERNLKLQEVENKVFVKGLTKVKMRSYEDFVKLFEIGSRNRKVFSTNANRSSSRSHAIMQVQTSKKSNLTLIDLAGSERMKITENKGERLKESSYINQSLLALINCINTLSKNSKSMRNGGQEGAMKCTRVKYRDSKLTHLLKNSLTNNGFIIMIAHVNPESKYYQDSYNTIKYALRAKNVELKQAISKGKCGKEVIKNFTKELLYLVNIMKNQMNDEQLKQIRDDMCKSNLIGRPIFECLYIGQLSLESFNEQVIQATIDKCSQTHNPRILEAIKQSWTENLKKRINSLKTGSKAPKPKLSKSVKDLFKQNQGDKEHEESDEDEFLDAEVVSAKASSPSVSPKLRPMDMKTLEKLKESEKKPSESIEESKEAEDDPDTELSISEISDLDDDEPETNDLVIGMLDKVTRPSSKKFGPPLWKVKLKYGIMQVNNVEIPFDTLEGEFEF
ncbi:kinesin [Theileria orientalis strain Shintoku]|uniref:Kinesin n=1 Tax=Theileria orientalis strain Shintoku TaxID=869250 RepID=J4C7T2_THEOR|nr:kinesin [Theileria orientalis strain Shintoku]PVC49573.1 kinesin [Theileria orientalis]BAM39583.1 kinesin [Theileria orientalis strain Shintoku]|eukprot:XP_009689884.1 kinesin [Theileria orientalis strain Shintoku]